MIPILMITIIRPLLTYCNHQNHAVYRGSKVEDAVLLQDVQAQI